MTTPVFTHRHVVTFEETNVVGNVYFARHIAWQGSCREMFLRDNAPGTLVEIAADLRLVTVSVACDYFQELRAFDEIELGMSLVEQTGNRILLSFDYRLARRDGWQQVARGRQEIRSMRQRGDTMVPCPIPDELATALRAYRASSGGPPARSPLDPVNATNP
ncbi:acyl-CoA thioesterase [Puniceibacterium sediminis]|uniref:Enediyne biosynthesis thioesterase n=1 Tax=Puniceibacterium sediminis TaxID=1608407 RepID=A0A238Z4Q4_9RHOB|nr:acyl-CoA thioesterase [Puniceibacterium sediminis]SNR77813.1 enediyne biosynthesis thioesterase [Puniceibacterium sediminis]